jgi:hypothetical protein
VPDGGIGPIEDGLIRDIELFFDARPFEAMQRAQTATQK